MCMMYNKTKNNEQDIQKMTKQKTGPQAVYIKQLTAQRKRQKKKTGYPAIRTEHCVEVLLRDICSMNLK